MTKDVTLSLRIDKNLSVRLERSAKLNRRSKSSLAEIAIERYLESEEFETERTKRAFAESEANGPFFAHEDVAAWLKSWGKPDELPPPRVKRSSK